jgi:hypothetical protein
VSADDEIRRTHAEDDFAAILADAVAKVTRMPVWLCKERFAIRRCWTCWGIADEREVATQAGPATMWLAEHEPGCTADLTPPSNPIWN